MIFLTPGLAKAEAEPIEEEPKQHNWEVYSTHYETVEAGTHTFTYWKNFIEKRRTCQISHKVKTVVYYCSRHDHTDSKITFEETLHSEKHSDHY
ncbi:hypothetical protein SAMN05216238_11033 [Lentibacillus persicus]|uniref:Uncharacterized protein n=2 Tax=Lentibacillus persicus TaxID=640948 RepID=A0A1I1YNS9_9BACI|nr:hypothetical protein SAMN05216238_11033 [Lentibacillus persicus]